MTFRPYLILALAIFGLAAPTPVDATQHHDPHALTLSLDDGERWPTDAPLRQGMDALRVAVLSGPASDLPGRIDAQVDHIIANCQLPPDADAQLHILIEQLVEAADRMRAGDPAEGRHQAVATLNAYGAHFDHPGWTPLGD